MGAIPRSATKTRAMSCKAVLSLCLSLTYGGTTYHSCTTAGGLASWCYTEVSSAGVGVTGKYGDCGTSSACTGQSATASDCITTGGKVVGAACVFPFTYGGTSYSKCTTVGGFAPWCYTEVSSAGVGVTGKYGDCGTNPACTGQKPERSDK